MHSYNDVKFTKLVPKFGFNGDFSHDFVITYLLTVIELHKHSVCSTSLDMK